MDNFIILDLFCGAGGFSYGMHQNNHFRTAVAVDFNSAATETFKKNMPDTHVITGDITREEIKKEVIKASKEKNVNMIIGGPPCQGFAMKGKKLGLKDPRNFLFLEYLNIVQALQPQVFVIENVKRLLTTENGWFKDEILNYICELGYQVDYGVLNACDFGVPQSRERAIFICSKDRKIPLPKITEQRTTVREAISDLAYLDSGEGDFEQKYRYKPESQYQEMMRKNVKLLYNHKATNHSKVALDKLSLIPPEKGKEFLPKDMRGKQQYNTTWCRLEWDTYSPTIDTRFDTPSNGTNSHPELNRSITPREAARIQSFSDEFIFYGTKSEICKQIGNAVPPLLAKAIADQIWNSQYYSKSTGKEIHYLEEPVLDDELPDNAIDVSEIPMSSRLRTILFRSQIKDLRQVEDISEEQMLKIRNMGAGTKAELIQICELHGVHVYSRKDLEDESIGISFTQNQYEQIFREGIRSKEDVYRADGMKLKKIFGSNSAIYKKMMQLKQNQQ